MSHRIVNAGNPKTLPCQYDAMVFDTAMANGTAIAFKVDGVGG
jgi:hypothetical protein